MLLNAHARAHTHKEQSLLYACHIMKVCQGDIQQKNTTPNTEAFSPTGNKSQ
jgi:hypothetical protein